MSIFRTLMALLAALILASPLFAAKREIAITIDDLPFVGEDTNFHLNMIIDALKTGEVPATGFVIASKVNPTNWAALQKFREAGFGIGNHTLTHANLARLSLESDLHEIDAADKILSPLMEDTTRYFRYPYLAMGNGAKKERLLQHLQELHYQIAPITIDSRDFVFNQLLMNIPEKQRRSFLDSLRACYLDFIWQQTLAAEEHNRINRQGDKPQILLVHANLLNAYVLPDIINMYRQNGYAFVSLENALAPESTRALAQKAAKKSRTGKSIARFLAWD